MRKFPANREVRHFGIRIDRNGIWHYQGTPIRRLEMVKLFASVLQRDESGKFWLVTPTERGIIDVEDAPFLAVEVNANPGDDRQKPSLVFRTNLDIEIRCDTDHPLRIEVDPETLEPSPYIVIRDGLEARLTRSVFYDLVDLAIEREIDGERILGVWSADVFFQLGPALPKCEP